MVSKENPREAEDGSKEGDGKRLRGYKTFHHWGQGSSWGGRGARSWDGDTKCINVPPRHSAEVEGKEAAVCALLGLQLSPHLGTPQEWHCLRLPDGKDLSL